MVGVMMTFAVGRKHDFILGALKQEAENYISTVKNNASSPLKVTVRKSPCVNQTSVCTKMET